MEPPKSLVLIRARHLAESVMMPTFLVDGRGTLIHFNEAAERMVGVEHSAVGPLSADEWRERFDVRSRDGSPFPLDEMPGWLQLHEQRATYGHIVFAGADGSDRTIAICAIPLFAQPGELEGALIVFWEDED